MKIVFWGVFLILRFLLKKKKILISRDCLIKLKLGLGKKKKLQARRKEFKAAALCALRADWRKIAAVFWVCVLQHCLL